MIKPLNQIAKRPSTATPVTKEPASQAGSIVPHSGAQLARSNKYHKQTVANPHTRAVDGLNPTSAIPAHRMFPGLAN